MKNEKKGELLFPKITKTKQQSIYGANGSRESAGDVVDLPDFDLTFDGGGGTDFGDDYDYYRDTFGDGSARAKIIDYNGGTRVTLSFFQKVIF